MQPTLRKLMTNTRRGDQALSLLQEIALFDQKYTRQKYNNINGGVSADLGWRAALRAACILALANPNDPRFANNNIPISDKCIERAGGVIRPDGTVGPKQGDTYARSQVPCPGKFQLESAQLPTAPSGTGSSSAAAGASAAAAAFRTHACSGRSPL